MKKRRTKILALFLAATMTVGSPVAAFTVSAEDWQTTEEIAGFEGEWDNTEEPKNDFTVEESEATPEASADAVEETSEFFSSEGGIINEVPTEDSGETTEDKNTIAGLGEKTEYADGTYTPDGFSFSGGTGKVSITCPTIVIENGIIYGNILFSSTKYTQIKLNGEIYPVLSTTGGSLFKIPVVLNQGIAIKATTTAMTEAHDVDYVIKITQDTSKFNKAEENADYTAVDAALASIPEDLSVYTDETVAAVNAAKAAIVRDYGKDKQAEVDKMAEDLNAAIKALVLKDIQVETTELTTQNTTGMFKVTKAALLTTANGTVLQFTLGSTGYEYIFKGTYEEAVANGNNRDSWVKYELANDGAYQFTIPVSEGETYIPLVSISKNKLSNFANGTGTLENAFYARQLVIDYAGKTLTAGDYDHTASLTVDKTNAGMFTAPVASLHTIASPAANNYSETLELTMGSTSFDKIYVGNALTADEADVEQNALTIDAEKKVNIQMSKNEKGGVSLFNYLEQPLLLSFHSVKNNNWNSRKLFTVSKVNGSLTIVDYKPATAVSLDQTEAEVVEGQSFDLTATVTPEKTSDVIKWSSSNEKVATVKDGKVTGISAGTAQITVTVGAVSAVCDVTVGHKEEILPAIAATCTKDGWSEGKKCSVCGLILKSRKLIKATGHKEEIIPAVAATPGHTGLTQGKKCSVCGEILEEQKVIPALPILVTKLKVSTKTSAKIAAGKKVQLTVTATPGNAENKAVTWKSSNKKVATVNSKGLVTMKKNAGGKSVVITATAKDGSKVYGKIKLTCMKGVVKKITISGKKTVKAGKSLTLKAKVEATKKANKSIAWSSSNKKLATVSSKGVVKTFKGKKGTVKITAKALDGSGKKATFKIKIK